MGCSTRVVTVRPATPEDAAPLATIARLLGLQATAADIAADVFRYEGGFYAAEIDKQITGFLVVRNGECPPCVIARSPLQLWRIYIHPDLHGSGVASRLLSAAMEHARANNHDTIWLGTGKDNARAASFYRKAEMPDDFNALGHPNSRALQQEGLPSQSR